MLELLLVGLTVCWQAPTENVDGSAITELPLSYEIYYGVEPGNYINQETPAPGSCHVWSPPAGSYYIAMTAIDAAGDESAYSNEVLKVQPAGPQPPVILAQEETVYSVDKVPDRFVLLGIGTVPAGTVCDLNANAPAGYGVVPFNEVVWAPGSTVRPIVVVARCSG